MGSRLSYKEDIISRQKDSKILSICQQEILLNTPYSCIISLSHETANPYYQISIFFETLDNSEIEKAFESKKFQNKYFFEITQYCGFAFNDSELQELVSNLIKDKTFFCLNEKGLQKRRNVREIILNSVKKKLFEILPTELKCLSEDTYFITYLSELFLPIRKDKIIYAIDKYFELINLDKNYFYKNGCIDEELYNSIQLKINTYQYQYKFKHILEKYFNDPEYMSKERLMSLTKRTNIIDKNEDELEDKKTLLVI
jgi:hypothetical protein